MSPRRFTQLSVVCLVFAVLASPASAKKKKPTDPDDLFNPMLGPEYAQWLVGPIVEMATAEEVERYLELITDEEAAAFIADFWEARNQDTPVFEKTPQQVFDDRVVEADKRFTEGAFPGSRTDRGKIYIVFGEPESIKFERQNQVDAPTLEVWYYPEDAPEGLGGEPPERRYRFAKFDGETILYTGQRKRHDPRDDLRRNRDGWSG